MAIVIKAKIINDIKPQKTDAKKTVDAIKKNTSRLVILLKNKGLSKNWSMTKIKLIINNPVVKPLL